MIPIRDTAESHNVPYVNNCLIGINVVVYLYQLTLGPELEPFILVYGLVPARYSISDFGAYFSLSQNVFALFSFMFLHGGFLHILGNMWSLYIFGDNVEDRLGPLRYLCFYLLCGLGSGLAHLVLNFYSTLPTIGASGAIAGVMGAFFLLHPQAKILTLIPIIVIPWFVEIPAFIFLGIWFVLQFFNAAGASQEAGGVAWWAHIGGFVFGMIFIKLLGAVPRIGVTGRVRSVTARKTSHRLQVIYPAAMGSDAHLYGTLYITAHEAGQGVRKLVNIPWGFKKRLIRVTVPAGMRDGSSLRLKGLGKILPDGQRGDLYLKLSVRFPPSALAPQM